MTGKKKLKVDWQDQSSYSAGERGTKEPSVWETRVGDMRVTVHRYFGCTGWFLSCHVMGLSQVQLDSEGVDDAKAEALRAIRDLLKTRLRAFEGVV